MAEPLTPDTIPAGTLAAITGGGRGIGRAVAIRLADAGVRIALIARSREQLDEVTRTIREAGGDATGIVANLAERDGIDQAVAALAELGTVRILVNNAATVAPLGPTVDLHPDAFSAALALNVVAPALLAARLAPAMLERGWGRIANVSSGIVAHPGSMIGGNVYATTKAALEAHTQNLAAEFDGTGVTVNVFRPGSVNTAMQQWIREQDPAAIGASLHSQFARNYDEGRLITPEQSAASLVRRLAGSASGQIWDASDPPEIGEYVQGRHLESSA